MPGADWYHDKFGQRYPFGKYDQAFVPEFNAGGAGVVTFRTVIFRSAVTESGSGCGQRSSRMIGAHVVR
jgi:aminopeptidase N